MKIQKIISKNIFPKLTSASKYKTLSTAESCTGGLLAKTFTDLAGSSNYFVGGIISYSNQVKINELFVSAETLNKFGAVSEKTAVEMAKGCIKKFNTDFAISITGIAGPSGSTELKPVGLVFICIIDKTLNKTVYKYNFGGDRQKIRNKTTRKAILNLFRFLKNND